MKIMKFLTKWSELITIPIALILWWLSPGILRMLDSTAATYDAGIFQVILFAIIQFLIYCGIVWIYLKIAFPNVYKYLDDVFGINLVKIPQDMNHPSNQLSTWQKSVLVLWLFSLLLISIVILSRVIQ